jgi:PhnB protein
VVGVAIHCGADVTRDRVRSRAPRGLGGPLRRHARVWYEWVPVSGAQNFGAVGIMPQLSVRGGRAAIEFYKAAFGAIEVYRVGGTDDSPEVVAQLSVGSASFWVSDEAPASANFSPESVGGGTVRMLLIVDDPSAALEQAKLAGAAGVYPVTDEHGWRLGRVEDPFSHHWEIGKPLVPWPPADGRPTGNH